MPGPLLETKLYLPRAPRGLVPRSRLTERLERGAGARLMLVSAPAGFGKSALDRGNLFLVPVDDRRRWYRYHHLFADVLHTRARTPAQPPAWT